MKNAVLKLNLENKRHKLVLDIHAKTLKLENEITIYKHITLIFALKKLLL